MLEVALKWPQNVRRLAIASALLCVTSCASPPPLGWQDRHLLSGSTLGALANGSATVAVLLFDPSHCFSCEGDLTAWREWASMAPSRSVLLVLTRQPTDIETNELTRQRIPVAGIASDVVAPVAVVFSKHQVVDSAVGQRRVRLLLRRYMTNKEDTAAAVPAKPDVERE